MPFIENVTSRKGVPQARIGPLFGHQTSLSLSVSVRVASLNPILPRPMMTRTIIDRYSRTPRTLKGVPLMQVTTQSPLLDSTLFQNIASPGQELHLLGNRAAEAGAAATASNAATTSAERCMVLVPCIEVVEGGFVNPKSREDLKAEQDDSGPKKKAQKRFGFEHAKKKGSATCFFRVFR